MSLNELAKAGNPTKLDQTPLMPAVLREPKVRLEPCNSRHQQQQHCAPTTSTRARVPPLTGELPLSRLT